MVEVSYHGGLVSHSVFFQCNILLLQGSVMAMDRYAAAESFYKLGMAFAPVPDLHIMWLLHLCDAHQEMQSWAEAAQCAVAVAGVIMQVIIYKSGMCFYAQWIISAVWLAFKLCSLPVH